MATITTLQAPVTKTAAFNGASFDSSVLDKNTVIKVRVTKLTAGKKATLGLQYSTDNFATVVTQGPVFDVLGEIKPEAERVLRPIRTYDFPSLPVGVAGSKIRLALLNIDASASIDYSSWIED